MKQLTVTLKTNTHKESSSNEQIQPPTFNVLTHFAPAEKNEKQLKFKKTTKSAGRKQKMGHYRKSCSLYVCFSE